MIKILHDNVTCQGFSLNQLCLHHSTIAPVVQVPHNVASSWEVGLSTKGNRSLLLFKRKTGLEKRNYILPYHKISSKDAKYLLPFFKNDMYLLTLITFFKETCLPKSIFYPLPEHSPCWYCWSFLPCIFLLADCLYHKQKNNSLLQWFFPFLFYFTFYSLSTLSKDQSVGLFCKI